jgi:hypothetical protein
VNIFKPTIGQESLYQDSNDNGVRLVNFATSKNLVVKSTMFPHRNIHKYTWTSPGGKAHNQIDHVSPNIVQVIKSRRMRWAGHVAHMGEERGVYRVLVGKETTGET